MDFEAKTSAAHGISPRGWGLALVVLFAAVYVAPLGVRPLFRPDEDRYAEIPREMLASGDWVVPHLDGIPYLEKPALGYWLTAFSIRAFGHNNFAVRLPAALAAGAAALAVFFLARRFWGSRLPAALPPAVLLTCGQFFAIGGYAVLDMPLTMFLTAAMVFFFFAYRAEGRGEKAQHLALFGLCCGGAFLAKGFLAFAVPLVAIVPFLVWERRTGGLLRLAWVPLGALAVAVGPWALLIHLREPGFWRYFVVEEHLKRFASHEAAHASPFWFYLPVMLGGALPWTALLPAAARGLRREGFRDPLMRFALCWLLLPFLFYSVCRGKLFSYVLPCFPPLALLMAAGLHAYLARGGERAFGAGARILAGLLLGGAVAVAALYVVGPQEPFYGPGEGWKAAWLAGALAGAGVVSGLAARQRGILPKAVLFSAAPWLVMAALPFVLPVAVEEWAAPGRLLARNAHRVAANQPLLACSNSFRSVCWQYGRSDVLLVGDTGELGSGAPRGSAHARCIPYADFASYIADCPADTRVTVVMTPWLFQRIRGKPPRPEFEDSVAGYLFLQYRGGQR